MNGCLLAYQESLTAKVLIIKVTFTNSTIWSEKSVIQDKIKCRKPFRMKMEREWTA